MKFPGLSWLDSQKECVKFGWQIISIHSREEQELIRILLGMEYYHLVNIGKYRPQRKKTCRLGSQITKTQIELVTFTQSDQCLICLLESVISNLATRGFSHFS